MRALIYLRIRLLINGIVSIVTNPRRLAFALFFVVWMAFSLISGYVTMHSRNVTPTGMAEIPPGILDMVLVAIVVMLTVTVVQRGLEGSVFAFAAADYDYLFAAPVSRRLVVAARVAADAFSTVLWTAVVLTSARVFSPINWAGDQTLERTAFAALAAGIYAVFASNMARIIQLVLAGGEALFERARAWLQKLGIVVIVCSAVACLWALSGGEDRAGQAMEALYRPPWSYVLWPMLAVVSLLSGHELAGGSATAVGVLCGLCLAACSVVCLLDRDVVEATIENSERVARLRSAMKAQDFERIAGERLRRARGKRSDFLVNWRSPYLVHLYRALAEYSHGGTPRYISWGLMVVAPAVLGRLLGHSSPGVKHFVGPVIAYMLVVASSFHALRFRSELTHVPLLRTIPLPPWSHALAIVVPRGLLQSVIFLMGMAAFIVAFPGALTQTNVAVAICVPLGCILASVAGAFVACVFPNSADAGQRLLGGLMHMLVISACLVPCIAAIALGMAAHLPGALAGALGGIGLLLPTALLAWGTGAMFARFEPGDE